MFPKPSALFYTDHGNINFSCNRDAEKLTFKNFEIQCQAVQAINKNNSNNYYKNKDRITKALKIYYVTKTFLVYTNDIVSFNFFKFF